ncbi:MAG: xanthine dehydrogenase family protein molybdopterin-binding subunit [Candidatus Acidiferrales bacterium]
MIGARLPRVDGIDKVTGRGKFTADHVLPGMLHAALVKSSYARGHLKSIDASRARELPGVVEVITGERTEESGCVSPFYGVVVRDRRFLAAGEVRFVGEPVAVVVAETRAAARRAAQLVQVDIEELPAAASLEAALVPNAPLVHTDAYEPAGELYAAPAPMQYGSSNIVMTYETSKGETRKAFEEAAHVIEETYTFPAVYHYAMEPHCVLADAHDREITVYSSAQHPNQVEGDIARMWGRPLSTVRVIATYLGGAFGSKSFTHIEPIAVFASLITGRPVRLELDISEAMQVSRRHGMRGTFRVALDGSGRLTAYEANLDYDGGAYSLLGPYVVAKGAFRALGGYDFPSYRVKANLVYTNTSPAGSFRAIGGPPAAWGLESMLDKVARHLSRDPVELRHELVAERGVEMRPGRTPMDANLHDTLDLVAEFATTAREKADLQPVGSWRRGSAMALGICDPGASPVSSAIVRLLADGSVAVSIGSTELGQGVRTVVAQIVAETLQVEAEKVHVLYTDTGSGPYDASTGASRSTTMSGLAAHRAALAVRRRLCEHLARTHSVDADELSFESGTIRLPSGSVVTLANVVHEIFGARGGNLIGVGEVTRHEFPTTPPFWEISGGHAEVAVDTGTGEIRLLAYVSVSDVGRVVNPVTMEGQEEGAFAQGLGHTIFEEMRWDAGQPVTDSLVNYRVPRATDMPNWFHSAQVENADGPGAFGIKGGGEGPIMPVAPAIGAAVKDATGVEIRDLPLNPERVWRALVAAGLATNHAAGAD